MHRLVRKMTHLLSGNVLRGSGKFVAKNQAKILDKGRGLEYRARVLIAQPADLI